jgi:nucleotide-binding universal stress UspA family protein
VLHRAPCPVLVGGEVVVADREAVEENIPRLPLVAWDRSPGGRRALDLAVRYAAATSGQLRVVHAGSESADTDMDEAHVVLSRSTVAWESARLDLDPAEAVAETRTRWDTDCLFMGAFGRGRLRGLLFGSHTAEILECNAGPVFVTP